MQGHIFIIFYYYSDFLMILTKHICDQSQAAAGEMISIEGLTIVWYTLIVYCVHLGSFYIAAWFDQNWTTIFTNNDRL